MNVLRQMAAWMFRVTPGFRGKGRLVLLADAMLTKSTHADSYVVIGRINLLATMHFDLRPWGQKFAYYYGEWEREYIELSRQLYAGGAFVDVGSSLGLYVICLGDLVRRAGGVVISVEPVAFNMDRQKANVALNGLESCIRYFPVALGASAGEVTVITDPKQSDNNAMVATDGDLKVPVVTMDSLVQEADVGKIGFIKIDVEGYEPMVIEGARSVISRDHPIIFAEFNRERMQINGFDIAPSWRLLVDQGYRAFSVRAGRLAQLDEPGEAENIFFLPANYHAPRELFV